MRCNFPIVYRLKTAWQIGTDLTDWKTVSPPSSGKTWKPTENVLRRSVKLNLFIVRSFSKLSWTDRTRSVCCKQLIWYTSLREYYKTYIRAQKMKLTFYILLNSCRTSPGRIKLLLKLRPDFWKNDHVKTMLTYPTMYSMREIIITSPVFLLPRYQPFLLKLKSVVSRKRRSTSTGNTS